MSNEVRGLLAAIGVMAISVGFFVAFIWLTGPIGFLCLAPLVAFTPIERPTKKRLPRRSRSQKNEEV